MPARRSGPRSASASAARRLAARSLFLCLSCAGALAGTEVFARACDPFGISYYRDTNRYVNAAIVLPPDAGRADGRLFENAAGADLELRAFRFRTDARGLRRGASEPVDPAGRLRALFLGDSVTLAWGVDDEDSWVRSLERTARAADGRELACFNAGHLQYNTLQEADWLRAHGAELAPELVVLTVVVNDVDDAFALYTRAMQELAAAQATPPGLRARLRQTLAVRLRGLHGLAHYARERRTARTAAERSGERLADQPGFAEGWARVVAGLEGVRARCAELGAALVVLDHTTPSLPDLAPWCARNGVPCFDFRFTPEEWQLEVRNSRADAHANALGNRLLAEKARAALERAGFLAAPED